MPEQLTYSSSLFDFHRARRRANIEQILARLTGRSANLLSYDDVRGKLKLRGGASRGLKDIPLDAIVGSVGRYTDFSKTFLPLQTVNAKRWTGVANALTGSIGLPPIEVYKIGEAYFVLDGNHRVSIARDMGAHYIEAYVTEVYTRVPLSSGDSPDDLILKERYADFLEMTRLDELRPEIDLTTTAPGQYRKLLEHIDVHRYFMGIDDQRDIPYEEAVTHWYDHLYYPVVESIREQNVLRYFPARTETDLYIWVMEHRAALAEELGWHVDPTKAVADLAVRAGTTPGKVFNRVRDMVIYAVAPDTVVPDTLSPHSYATELVEYADAAFARDILVPVTRPEEGWAGLDFALIIARKEGSKLHGLHVVNANQEHDESLEQMSQRFRTDCQEADVNGELTIVPGVILNEIVERARFVDLMVIQLMHPPGPGPVERLGSKFRSLLLRSPVPVLAVPHVHSNLERVLIAYDGTPKSREALFIVTYFARQWQLDLAVLTVHERSIADGRQTIDAARSYLESQDVHASYHLIDPGDVESTGVGFAIQAKAREMSTDLIVMGSYGHRGFVQAVLGSAVDQVLRSARQPVLLCG